MIKELSFFLLVAFYSKYTRAICIPCPRDGVTFSSFKDCNCPLGTFYNEATKSCVAYFECPLPPYRNPLPEIKALSPLVHNILSNSLDFTHNNGVKVHVPKDVTLISQALKKRYYRMTESIPILMTPIAASVAAKNSDLFEICKGNLVCVVRQALKRENNYDLIFPKLKSVIDEIIKNFHGIFDDLKEMAEKSCDENDRCPLIKGLVRLKEVFPGNLEETLDIMQIVRQIRTYLLKDLNRHLDSLIKV